MTSFSELFYLLSEVCSDHDRVRLKLRDNTHTVKRCLVCIRILTTHDVDFFFYVIPISFFCTKYPRGSCWRPSVSRKSLTHNSGVYHQAWAPNKGRIDKVLLGISTEDWTNVITVNLSILWIFSQSARHAQVVGYSSMMFPLKINRRKFDV